MVNTMNRAQTDNAVINEALDGKPGVPRQNINNWYEGMMDPLDDIQIQTASKKRFMEWWKKHTTAFPLRSERGVVDSGKNIKLTNDGINIRGVAFVVHDTDDHYEEFPFKLNSVDQFTLNFPWLHSLKNCPVDAAISAQYGCIKTPMEYLDSLIGCPIRCRSLSVVTKATMLNLENSLRVSTADITVVAPEFASFAGLTVDCDTLTIKASHQPSFRSIYKELKSNVKNLAIGVGDDFKGGVLGLAMLDMAINLIPDVSGNPPVGFTDAITMVADARKEGINVHDIQERLIDGGLGKYAQL